MILPLISKSTFWVIVVYSQTSQRSGSVYKKHPFPQLQGGHGQLNREGDFKSKLKFPSLRWKGAAWLSHSRRAHLDLGHRAEFINKSAQARKGLSGLWKDWLFLSPCFMEQSYSTALCHVDHICCHGQPDVCYCKPIQPCGPSSPTTLFVLLLQPDFVANDINTRDKGGGGRPLCFSL